MEPQQQEYERRYIDEWIKMSGRKKKVEERDNFTLHRHKEKRVQRGDESTKIMES